ncbi:MAG: hypothetical protein U1F43_34775, partial [Myxococcota bacterium]
PVGRLARALALALGLAPVLGVGPAEAEPIPPAARGRGALGVSGDGRFGLFAGRRELVTWELADGKKKLRVPLAPAAWELAPSPSGETTFLVAPDRLVDVMLLTGRVVADLPVAAGSQTPVRELAWTPDGTQVLLLGWELAELGPGEGTPLAYYDPKLGYVMRQIRIPGLVESRGMVVLKSGFDVVIGTPKRLVLLGLGVASVRTVALADAADGAGDRRLVAAVAGGVLSVRGGQLELLDPERGRVTRTLELAPGPPRRWLARPLGRWVVGASDDLRAFVCVDVEAGAVDVLDPRALGGLRAALPMERGLLVLGREARVVDLATPLPDDLRLVTPR